MIPYKNPKALIAYYTGIGAMVPVLGIVLAPVAIVLGIMGLIARQKNPAIKGSVHAWIGIVGGLGGLLLNACILFAIFAAVSGEMQDNRGQYEMPADTY